MKYTDLIDSGYLEFNTSKSDEGKFVYEIMPDFEVYIGDEKIVRVVRYPGINAQTYLVEFANNRMVGEGLSQFQRVYFNEELKVFIFAIRRTLVKSG